MAVDGPYLGVAVDQPFLAAVQRTPDIGFDGNWAIDPRQLEQLNRRFVPTAEELRRARDIVSALDKAERDEGHGAVAHDGTMIDEAVRARARLTLAKAARES
jgi:citrate lyase subunit beta / citryl-CoA lyase